MPLLIMSEGKKTYWKGIEQLKNDPAFVKNAQNEFPEFLPIQGSSDNSRRDFLKMMGFGLAAVPAAACEAPVKTLSLMLINQLMLTHHFQIITPQPILWEVTIVVFLSRLEKVDQ